MAVCDEARVQPIACATLSTSSGVLFTRTKNATLMSARMLSWQIRPFFPWRSISTRLTEISMYSARSMIGNTVNPLNETFVPRSPVRTIARPCSTFRKQVRMLNSTPMKMRISNVPPIPNSDSRNARECMDLMGCVVVREGSYEMEVALGIAPDHHRDIAAHQPRIIHRAHIEENGGTVG